MKVLASFLPLLFIAATSAQAQTAPTQTTTTQTSTTTLPPAPKTPIETTQAKRTVTQQHKSARPAARRTTQKHIKTTQTKGM